MSLLNEAELHGLVDGHLDVDRRGDVLRRLAASAADRALVESWQEQNDLIRAAFRDVERELLPVPLDLAPPRLRCIDSNVVLPAASGLRPAARRRNNTVAAVVAALVVAGGLVGSWLVVDQVSCDDVGADPRPRDMSDAALADRAATAVKNDPRGQASLGAALPITRIPDLTAAGFVLTSASTDPTEPPSLVFHYRDGGAGRLAIGIARAARNVATAAPTQIGRSFTWHRGDAAYALAGTLAPGRLREIAVSLQSDDGTE